MTDSAAFPEIPAGAEVLDLRTELKQGKEPFPKIMSAWDSLEAGRMLVLRTPFPPKPLVGVFSGRGVEVRLHELAADDWLTFIGPEETK